MNCGDQNCNQDREKKMVRVGKKTNGNYIFCDPCIVPIIKALNEGGIETMASCCGHGRRPGVIIFSDDTWLTISTREEADEINKLFHTDINGDPFPPPTAHKGD